MIESDFALEIEGSCAEVSQNIEEEGYSNQQEIEFLINSVNNRKQFSIGKVGGRLLLAAGLVTSLVSGCSQGKDNQGGALLGLVPADAALFLVESDSTIEENREHVDPIVPDYYTMETSSPSNAGLAEGLVDLAEQEEDKAQGEVALNRQDDKILFLQPKFSPDDNVEIPAEEIDLPKQSVERIITQEEKEFLANNEISSFDRGKPLIAMTYDDGGKEEYIRHIMEVYEKYGLKTTFFVTGQWVESNRELVKEMIDRGFEIGCHGWDHAVMPALSREEANTQIKSFIDVMREVSSDYQVNFIRFPYGSRTQPLREIAAEYGLQSIMWSKLSGGEDTGTYDNVMRGLQAGDIVLSHSTRWYDVYDAERIIIGLLEQGYNVVTVGEGMELSK